MAIIFDADSLVYSCGFSCQKKEDDGSISVVEPFILYSRIDKAVSDIMKELKQSEIQVFLTSDGKDNFRHQIAKTKPYKGNRTAPRPVYYDQARDRLVRMWGATIITGMEADDAVSIAQWQSGHQHIVCSQDKDLLQIPGKFYNYRTKKKYRLSPEKANLWFWMQCLIGDASDNIPGLKGWGKVRSKRLLAPLTPEARKSKVREMYNNDELLQEVGSLLYLLRSEDDKFDLETYT